MEGCSKRRRKPRILTPKQFSRLIVAVNREPCRTMVILALCTGVRCSELVALKWSDFDCKTSVYIRRAIVAGRLDDVKTEYSEGPAAGSSISGGDFEWRRRTEFSSESDFLFASSFMAGEKPCAREHTAQPSEPARSQSRVRTHRLACASP